MLILAYLFVVKPMLEEDARTQHYTVAVVIDGDTLLDVADDRGATERIRILGIDTPEEGDYGYTGATARPTQRRPHRTPITAIGDPSHYEHDAYGRLLAYVEHEDDTDIGLTFVTEGYAREYTYDVSHARATTYKKRGTPHTRRPQLDTSVPPGSQDVHNRRGLLGPRTRWWLVDVVPRSSMSCKPMAMTRCLRRHRMMVGGAVSIGHRRYRWTRGVRAEVPRIPTPAT